jgi:hypothetical protein
LPADAPIPQRDVRPRNPIECGEIPGLYGRIAALIFLQGYFLFASFFCDNAIAAALKPFEYCDLKLVTRVCGRFESILPIAGD